MNTVPYLDPDERKRDALVAAKMRVHMVKGVLVRKPVRDAVIIQAERVYKSSNQYQLDKLLNKAKLYRRRLTLAQNGLDENQREIQRLLLQIAGERMSEPVKEVK